MIYYAQQWGDNFFTLEKIQGYERKSLINTNKIKISKKVFSKLVLYATNKHPDTIFSNEAFMIYKWKCQGKITDILSK